MGMNDINELLQQRLTEIDSMINEANNFLVSAPNGTLNLSRCKNTVQYYWNQGEHRTYIPKGDSDFLRKLAQKEYTLKLLPELHKERLSIINFIERSTTKSLVDAYNDLKTEKQKYVLPYIFPSNEYAKQWELEQNQAKETIYKTNRRFALESEDLTENGILTEKGDYVRSKSEKIIADKLFLLKISYIYEAPLLLKGHGYIKPDFTVLNKRTRRQYIWEHFGMIDNIDYAGKTSKKLELYMKNGYIQGKNFLSTFESSVAPLKTNTLETIIQEFFL